MCIHLPVNHNVPVPAPCWGLATVISPVNTGPIYYQSFSITWEP
jgi:hypothetical protein